MSVFSSNRERRLWIFMFVVVVGIYSTLATSNRLAGVLREHGLLDISFAVGALLVGLTVIAHSLKSRPNMAGIVIALGVAAAYLLVFVRMANPAERTHLIEYGVVSILAYEALAERARNGRQVPVPALLAIILTSAIGVLDECVQAILPNRVFDPRDILFNALAAIMAILSTVALSWARQRISPGNHSD